MSWLTDALGLTDPGAAKAERRRQQREEEEAAYQKARAEEQWLSDFQNAAQAGEREAQSYFTGQGLDPGAYASDIENAIASVESNVPRFGSFGGAFSGIGPQLYGDLTRQLQSRSLGQAEDVIAGGPRIADTADDAIIEKILQEQQAGAGGYVENLLKRGVVNRTGYDAAMRDVGTQADVGRSRLSDLGSTILGGGRSALEGIANQGRLAATGLRLGQQFDPSTIGQNLQKSFDEFMGGLEGKFRAQAPTNIFNTGQLAQLAGQTQGPQNKAFNPAAVGGYGEDEEEENRGVTTVF